jgi:hypothetical protein
MSIGKPASLGEQILEEVDRPVIVLHRKALTRLREQVLGTHMHK